MQNSWGAALVDGLNKDRIEHIFYKGTDLNSDSYSVFFDHQQRRSTGLIDVLRYHKWQDLYFVGLVTDYCVLYSVRDALDLGFRAAVIRDACRAIHNEEGSLSRMEEWGARIILASEFLDE